MEEKREKAEDSTTEEKKSKIEAKLAGEGDKTEVIDRADIRRELAAMEEKIKKKHQKD